MLRGKTATGEIAVKLGSMRVVEEVGVDVHVERGE